MENFRLRVIDFIRPDLHIQAKKSIDAWTASLIILGKGKLHQDKVLRAPETIIPAKNNLGGGISGTGSSQPDHGNHPDNP